MKKAVLFDRDGVLNVDTDFVTDISQVILYDNAPDIIAFCRERGFNIFVITNQPGVARGILTEPQLLQINEQYADLVKAQNPAAIIDKIYYCPHHPVANVEKYRITCHCRKPHPGMIVSASRDFDVDLSESFVVGDRMSDIMAGRLAGCKTVLCLTGKHSEKPFISDLVIPDDLEADYVIDDLSALREILS